MKLTGKCKQDFEKWFIKWVFENAMDEYRLSKKERMYKFFGLPYSMRYGVLVSFFDSVKIIIDIQPVFDYDHEKYTKIIEYLVYVRELNVIDKDEELIECKTRLKARKKAILKANKIYNKK